MLHFHQIFLNIYWPWHDVTGREGGRESVSWEKTTSRTPHPSFVKFLNVKDMILIWVLTKISFVQVSRLQIYWTFYNIPLYVQWGIQNRTCPNKSVLKWEMVQNWNGIWNLDKCPNFQFSRTDRSICNIIFILLIQWSFFLSLLPFKIRPSKCPDF